MFCLVILSAISRVTSWGADGHMIVAHLAELLLEPETREYLQTLLGSDLASVANWADQADHTPAYAWTKCMHYVDSQDGVCAVNFPTDCGNCCVVSAIHNYTDRVVEVSAEKIEGLKFLIHFFGDVHQPLHAGRKSDQGGNAIHVHLEGRTTNLHSVWDSAILEKYLKTNNVSYLEYSEFLFKRINEFENFRHWIETCLQQDCALEAAEESAQYACEFAYTDISGNPIVSGQLLETEYLEERMVVVEERLAAAGVRLATVLNSIFTKIKTDTQYIEVLFQ